MKKIIFLYIIFFSTQISSQETIEDAWIFLKDKPNATTFLNNPLTMVSQRAIYRRETQGIAFDEKDVPIHTGYYNQIRNEENLTILGKSKWLNAIHVQATVSKIKTLSSKYNFIKAIEYANKSLNFKGKRTSKNGVQNHVNKFSNTLSDFNYGDAENQIKILKGNELHKAGLTGKRQIIAVIDAGFPNVNTLEAFKRIRDNNQILGGYNFADRNDNFYTRNSHGTHVLSTMAGYLEGKFVGTAPDASFYLFITEKAESETVLEETLWVEAAEKADSLGVDVINTSLGYTTFDNPNHSYSYADMDGKTTFISRGAEIANSRGILVVNAVGNSGNSAWKYLAAPADAASVISVGAVDAVGKIAPFSSFGPTSDNRIKPEILAQGLGVTVINFSSGQVSLSNGTSFSAPIVAGLIACLNDNEGFILKSVNKRNKNLNDYLKEELYKSADRYNNPTNQHGYGIPDFIKAFNNYISVFSVDEILLNDIKVIPNPVTTSFLIKNLQGDLKNYQITLFDILGKKVSNYQLNNQSIDISELQKGVYFLKLDKANTSATVKILKQ